MEIRKSKRLRLLASAESLLGISLRAFLVGLKHMLIKNTLVKLLRISESGGVKLILRLPSVFFQIFLSEKPKKLESRVL